MATRRDYVAAATILQSAIADAYYLHGENEKAFYCVETVQFIAEEFAKVFALDNPNFNEDRFFQAVHK